MRQCPLRWRKMLISMSNQLWDLNPKTNHHKCQTILFPNQRLSSPSEVTFPSIFTADTAAFSLGVIKPGVFTGSKVSFISGWYPSFLCLLLKLKAFFVPVWRKSRISGRQEGLWLGPKTRQSVTSKSIKTPVTNLMKWHASGLATSTYWAAQRSGVWLSSS